MVDLRQLGQIAAESEEVGNFMERATKIHITRGVSVRPLPLWKLLHYQHFLGWLWWAIHRVGRLPVNQPWFNRYIEDIELQFSSQIENTDDTVKFDLSKPPPEWDEVARYYYGSLSDFVRRTPLLLTAMVHYDVANSEDDEGLSQLRGVVNESRLPAIIERNHDSRLHFAAGDGIIAGAQTGVAGGFLTDPTNGELFGVTCAHVAPARASITDFMGNPLATCVAATSLVANNHNLACDPRARGPAAPINDLDIALVKMSASVAQSGLSSATNLRHGQSLDVRRASFATRRFQIRSLVMCQQLIHQAATSTRRYCYENLVELFSANQSTQGGDSGSWCYTLGGNWAAMVIGADPISTFTIRADDILDWARNQAFSPPRPSIGIH